MRFNPRQLASVLPHGSFDGLGDLGYGPFGPTMPPTNQKQIAEIWKDSREKALAKGIKLDGYPLLDFQHAWNIIQVFQKSVTVYLKEWEEAGGEATHIAKFSNWPPDAVVAPQMQKNAYYGILGVIGTSCSALACAPRTENYDSRGYLKREQAEYVWTQSQKLAIHLDVIWNEPKNAELWADIVWSTVKDTGSGLVDLGGKALEIGKWILIAGALIGGAVLVSRVLPSSSSPPPRKE